MAKKQKVKSKLLGLLNDFDNIKKKFYKKVENEGFDVSVSEDWWNKISSQASYSFALSHSYPYSKLSYLTMYLKKYYPRHFFISLLNNTSRTKENTEGTNKITAIIYSAQKEFNLKIYRPDINKSKESFIAEESGIRFGFNAIKDVGKATSYIVQNQPYESFEHFLQRNKEIKTINKRVVEALIFSGCFDCFETDRNKTYDYYSSNKKSKNLKQNTFIKQKDVKGISGISKLKLVQKEIEYLNYSFDDMAGSDEYPVLSAVNLESEKIKASAYIESFQEKVSKKSGKKYIYLKLTDFGTNLTTMIFGEVKDKFISQSPEKGMLVRFSSNKPQDFDVHFINTINVLKKLS